MSVLALRSVFAGTLASADLELEPGLNVVLGAVRDGSDTLVRLLAGLDRPRRGRVEVGGLDPFVSPRARARVGVLLRDEPPSSAKTLRQAAAEILGLSAARIDAQSLLDEQGLGGVAESSPARVPAVVRRHFALALALSTPEPLALVLHEPFAVGPLANSERTRERLAALADAGVCVVVVTASPRDAASLGGRIVLLDGGRFVRRPGDVLATELCPGRSIVLRVVSSGARRLLAGLAGEESIVGVRFDAAGGGELELTGGDADRAALALMRVARREGVDIEAIEPVLPTLDVTRAASQGLYRAAYEAAYQAARAQAQSRMEQRAGVIARSRASDDGEPVAEPKPAPVEPPSDGGET